MGGMMEEEQYESIHILRPSTFEDAMSLINEMGQERWWPSLQLWDHIVFTRRKKGPQFPMPTIPEPHEPKAPGPN